MAQKKISLQRNVLMFSGNILGFISDCYDFLHLNSYERALADAVEILAEREHISCEEALLRLSLSPVYDALYDYETGIWKESGEYLISLYNHYGK